MLESKQPREKETRNSPRQQHPTSGRKGRARSLEHGGAELYTIEATSGVALETSDAVTLLENLTVKRGGTMLFAIAAVCAESGRKPSEDAEMGHQAEQAPQGAEILAPIAPLIAFKKKDGRKEEERQECQRVKCLPKGKQIVPEKGIASIEDVPVVTKKTVKAYPALTEKVTD